MPSAAPGSASRADLVGTPTFWGVVGATCCAGIPFALFRAMRPWIGCAVLLLWTGFFTTNAIRSRRTHSVISAPVYLLAAAALGASAAGVIEVQIWMVWALGAGIIAANLSERVIGKYL
jgi:hypothetical protein